MPSEPTTTGKQVQPGAVQRGATKGDRLALDGEPAHLQHVVQRQAVLEAVHAAGVLGHVAADGAGDLARRVGRVVQAQWRGGLADGQVAHPALHHGRAAGGVDLQDAVELGQAQGHPQCMRHGATRQAGAGAARHHRHLEPVAGLQHGAHLVLGLGQCHHQRALPVGREAVAFIRRGVFAVPQQGMRRQYALQCLHHLGLARRALERRGLVRVSWRCSWRSRRLDGGLTVDQAGRQALETCCSGT
jgi:hypothetical protein